MEVNKKLIDPMIFNDPKKDDHPKELQKVMDFDVRTKSIEEKFYIILYLINDDELDEVHKHCFKIAIGRTSAYNDIKEKLISGLNIDIHRSRIITETKQTETSTGDRKYFFLPYEESISIYSFCISVSEYYSYDEFNIEDYNDSDIPDDGGKTLIEDNPGYLTEDQIQYRDMLESSMKHDKFFNDLKNELKGTNI